jgi:hypothetical protein
MDVTTLIKQYIGVEDEYDIMFNDDNPSELW